MSARLLAWSHYLHAVRQAPLPSLDEPLRASCRGNHRRVDRFIQLALLGAARCATGRSLDPACGLYLGSGLGPVGNNILVQEQICRDHQFPRPFNFVNTLGSSATFYVAKELGLEGQAWWAARRGATLEALLELALADLELGVCRSALVGVVEECPAPYEDQRLRIHAAPDADMAEGSHWLLLEAESGPGPSGRLDADFGLDGPGLEAALAEAWAPGDTLALGPELPADLAARLRALARGPVLEGGYPVHDSLAGARATDWLRTLNQSRLQIACGCLGNYARIAVAA